AEVEAQRRLARLWQATAPAVPTEAQWAGVLAAIQQAPHRPRTRWPFPSVRPLAWAAAVVGLAGAAVLFAMSLEPGGPPDGPGPRAVPRPEPPLPVASSAEVEILRIEGDGGGLLVARPPVEDLLAVVTAEEVEVLRVEGDDDSHLVWVGEAPKAGP